MLRFDHIASMGATHETRFFQAGFSYSTTKNLNIQGYVVDLANSWGVTGIWTGINTVVANANEYHALLINGVNFGSGRVTNLSFAPGNDVKVKTYSASVEVLESGNLFNFTGTYYSGVNLVAPTYLEDFNESYSFNKKLNGGYGYTHQADIRFTSGVGNLDAIQAAQTVARTLFTGGNMGFAFYSGYTNCQGKRFFTEAYNLIDNSCSFQESFDLDKDLGRYSAIHTNSVEISQEGVISSREQGTIRGIENVNYQSALSALTTELTGAYYRCSGVAQAYFAGYPILISSPLNQGRAVDIFNNEVSYTVSFDNNPNNSGTYYWDYTHELNRRDNITDISENGEIIGRGGNPSLAFSSAQGGFLVVEPGISGRVTALFVANTNSGVNYLTNKEQSYSPLQGRISYARAYSNDPALISNTGIRRKTTSVETARPLYQYNKVAIFNQKEIVQLGYQSTPGALTVKVDMEGDKTATLSAFLALATSESVANKPSANDVYIAEASYVYDQQNGKVDSQVTWAYNQPANRTIYP